MANNAVEYTTDFQIVHLSDLHFGSNHICVPEERTASSNGMRSLGQQIADDLAENIELDYSTNTDNATYNPPPVIIAISGDFTQTASREEFLEAKTFLNQLTSRDVFGQKLDMNDVFMVPGNHDVTFSSSDPTERFQQYCSFYNEVYDGIRPLVAAHRIPDLTQTHIIHRGKDKLLLAEINCSSYVQKNTVDQSRGQVDFNAIAKLRVELEKLQAEGGFGDYIKVAMIHHHLILAPSFIEPGRGVDSIVNSRQLLELLNEFEFHLILHGHKHYPQVFSYDPITPWDESNTNIPQVILAGGSCGSKELPHGPLNACNTYSIVNVKWHPNARQARIRVCTRGLVRRKSTGDLTPDKWKWKTVSVIDKSITPYNRVPSPGPSKICDIADNSRRQAVYQEVRGYLPVVEVFPSLLSNQAYEVRAWIVRHKPRETSKEQALATVEWSAGTQFKNQMCSSEHNPNFSVAYHYWGPTLIEAKLTFADGHIAYAYVYARLPTEEA